MDNRRVFGIDFSGARNAGSLIWICEAIPAGSDRLRLHSCRPASTLPASGPALAHCLAALIAFIADQSDAAFGCDFPFSVPLALAGGKEWSAYVADFAARFPEAHTFWKDCKATTERELRRCTDVDAMVPFCAYNLRLYKQTYHGIAGVLAPLLMRGRVAVLPMQRVVPGRALLLEVCPASLLRHLGLYGKYGPYKGAAAACHAARRQLLDALVDAGLLEPPAPELRQTLLDNRGGDALDSALAAIACHRALQEPGFDRPRIPAEAFEGRVYF
jgi:hypothetical protein